MSPFRKACCRELLPPWQVHLEGEELESFDTDSRRICLHVALLCGQAVYAAEIDLASPVSGFEIADIWKAFFLCKNCAVDLY